jgi:hypothetical protein
MSSRIDPPQKESSFSGKIYAQKDRAGNRQLVVDTKVLLAILNDSGVQAASTVSGLVAALIAAVNAQT